MERNCLSGSVGTLAGFAERPNTFVLGRSIIVVGQADSSCSPAACRRKLAPEIDAGPAWRPASVESCRRYRSPSVRSASTLDFLLISTLQQNPENAPPGVVTPHKKMPNLRQP